MTTPTDGSPSADDPGTTTEGANNSRPGPSGLNQALVWVGIAAGGVFIGAAIFLAGFFLSSSLGGPWGDHEMGPGRMACCDTMKPGAVMGPDGHMTPGEMMPGKTMMPGGMMGPAPQSPATTAPSGPRP
jgi:hypothetical protein